MELHPYPGAWGMSLNNPGIKTLSFTKQKSASYRLHVETKTPPNNSYFPTTDTWQVTIVCPAP